MSISSVTSPLAGGYGGLNGYWGQYGSETLREYCDTGIEYVTLGFVNNAPEHQLSGYPGTNFAGHCWAGVYNNDEGIPSQLLSECMNLKVDIPYCQERGVKVLLSIGGDYTLTSNYKVTTEQNGEDFAEFLYKAFGPYDPFWEGPRPFDASETEHSVVDGFDFDIEAKFDNKPYISMIETFRAHDPTIIITGAPQCPTSDTYFYMKELIQEAAFDALFVQFYNNPVCDTLSSGTGNKFNYDDWESIVEKSSKSKSAKLYVGLPASVSAASSGYVEPETVKDLVCKLKNKKHFGGISLWDLTRGAANLINGKSFNDHVLDALKYGCASIPTTTSTVISSTAVPTSTHITTELPPTTISTSTSASSASDITSTSIFTPITTPVETPSTTPIETPSTTPVETPSTTPVETPSTTPVETPSTTPIESPSATPIETSGITSIETPVSTPTDATTSDLSEPSDTATSDVFSTGDNDPTTSGVIPSSTLSFHTTHGWNTSFTRSTTKSKTTSTAFNPSTTGPDGKPTGNDGSVTSTGSVELTTSTAYTTRIHTVTKCPPYVENCPEGPYVTTETIPIYTTVCPVTKTNEGSKPEATKPVGQWTTSTVYTTRVHTVTKCPPYVENCPEGPHVTTETIPLSTTVVLVTETSKEVEAKTTKPVGKWTTSTVYTTRVQTVTKCPPEVKNCPEAPHVTTETLPVHTTVLYVTKTVKGPAPTGTLEKPGNNGKPGHGNNEGEISGDSDHGEKTGKPEKPGNGQNGGEIDTPTTIYTTLIVPPKTLETSAKPTIFTPILKPTSNGTVTIIPVASGTIGSCEGTGCPKLPVATAPTNQVSVATAGAASVAVGLGGLVALAALQVFAL